MFENGVESQALLVGLACMLARKSTSDDRFEKRCAHRNRSARFRPRNPDVETRERAQTLVA
jgi:hypothetical protein